MTKTSRDTLRIATNGVLIAVYVVLSYLSFETGGVKITLVSLPVILCAVLFGPIDALIVGLLGGFAEQMIRYGFTATTLLWILPEAVRGLFVGLSLRLLRQSADSIAKKSAVFFAVCLIAAPITSVLNTLVFAFDATLFGYYEYHMIWGVFGVRVALGFATALITAAAVTPVIAALRYSARMKR
ncbi:MAG: ECF transporter S component [Oscillospiraceae bacterium]|jgi:ECF transporter S component (folate family)|nr:ECF transporter S component [Oscillospiraceae bacterium]